MAVQTESNVKGKYLIYRNVPLVREGNVIYYGDMEEAYVLCLMIISYKEVPSSDNGAKVSVPDIVFGQIWSTDRTLPETDRVVKSFDKKGLAEALDFGITQLERYNKKSKAKS